MYTIRCGSCGNEYDYDPPHATCTCGAALYFTYDYKSVNFSDTTSSMWRYHELLPIRNVSEIVSLNEGLTPLITSSGVYGQNVYFKDETRNPTGSMKDRALSLAMTKVKESGKTSTVISSTGNAGIAASAYAARAGIRNVVLVPSDTVAERLIAMATFGSRIYGVDTNIEHLKDMVNRLTIELGWVNISTFRKANPYQSEAPKTIAYEIYEQLGRTVPDYVLVPVGGAGTLSGIYRGFQDLVEIGLTQRLPKLIAVHHQNYNSLELALKKGLLKDTELFDQSQSMDDSLPCIARNIQHTYCFDGEEALSAIVKTGGFAVSVDDREIIEAQKTLAEYEGIFAEPSSASVAAALSKLRSNQYIEDDTCIVGIISGSGFKETSSVRLPKDLVTTVTTTNFLDVITNLSIC